MNTFGLRKPVFAFWLGSPITAVVERVVIWCRQSILSPTVELVSTIEEG